LAGCCDRQPEGRRPNPVRSVGEDILAASLPRTNLERHPETFGARFVIGF
jgi:hypothetical protein